MLRTLLVSDLVDSTKLVEELGDRAAGTLFERHDRLARDLLAEHGGREIDKTDGFLLLFERPWSAVRHALAYHRALSRLSAEQDRRIEARVGIHLGEVVLRENPLADVERGAKPLEVEGLAKPTTARLMSLARGGQTLLTRNAFEPARRAAVGTSREGDLRWLAHGRYRFQGVEEPVEVFEVGEEGRAPLVPPRSTEKAKRARATQVWNVPFERNPFFTGRDDVLQELRKTLTQPAARRRTQTISGLGGVGKTQTAVEYAYRHRGSYDAVFWVAAETVDELEEGYVDIARRLDLAEKDATERRTAVRAALRWLETNGSWLLVLDNADTPKDLKGRLPKQHQGHVLLTSRAQSFGRVARPWNLETLPPAEAEAFLWRRAHRDVGSATECRAVAELARELGGLPLALEQAGAYVEETGAAFRTYLSGYRRRRLKLLDHDTAPEEHRPVATTWEMNFNEIEKTAEASADLLRAIAFLAPDSIPVELVIRGSAELGPTLAAALETAAEDELTLEDLLTPLRRYSLIQRDVEARSFSIHRLVQEAVKTRMDESTRRLWAERVVNAVARAFPGGDAFKHWTLRERLSAHGQVAVRLAKEWRLASREAALLFHQLGAYSWLRGLYTEAEAQFGEALAIWRRVPDADQQALAHSLILLATVLDEQGAYGQAERLCLEALEVVRRQGTEHAVAANCQLALARVVFRKGAYREAERLLREVLADGEGSSDEASGWLIGSLFFLGTVCYLQGACHEESERLLRRALEHARSAALPSWPIFQSSLALPLSVRGATEEAVTLCREAVAAFRQLDEELRDAERGFQAWSFQAWCRRHLALALYHRGSFEEAEEHAREALELFRRQFGDEHPYVAESLVFLGTVLVRKGAYEEVERLCLEGLDSQRRWLGDEHPAVADSLTSLALLRIAQSRFGEAEELGRQALASRRQALPADSWWIADSESVLGAALAGQGRYQEAEELLLGSFELLKSKVGPASYLMRDGSQRLVELYEAWSKPEKAIEYRRDGRTDR